MGGPSAHLPTRHRCGSSLNTSFFSTCVLWFSLLEQFLPTQAPTASTWMHFKYGKSPSRLNPPVFCLPRHCLCLCCLSCSHFHDAPTNRLYWKDLCMRIYLGDTRRCCKGVGPETRKRKNKKSASERPERIRFSHTGGSQGTRVEHSQCPTEGDPVGCELPWKLILWHFPHDSWLWAAPRLNMSLGEKCWKP